MWRVPIVAGTAVTAAAVVGAGLMVHAGAGSGPRSQAQPSTPTLVAAVTTASSAAAATSTSPDTLTVVGQGNVTATPNLLTIDLGASAHRVSVGAALAAANADVKALVAALQAKGVADVDMQTESLQVSEDYANGAPSGYMASSSLLVQIRHVDQAGTIIAAAAAALGNDAQFGSMNYSIANRPDLLQAARQAAMASALARANAWAQLAGRHVGRVLSVAEQTGTPAPAPPCYQGCGGGGGVPVETGTGMVSAVVTVVYQLID
jgi:uncharacterized protein YggE